MDLEGQKENIQRLRLNTEMFTAALLIIMKNEEEPKCPAMSKKIILYILIEMRKCLWYNIK